MRKRYYAIRSRKEISSIIESAMCCFNAKYGLARLVFSIERNWKEQVSRVCCFIMTCVLHKYIFTKIYDFFRFIIFNLLIPYIHREGGVGQQARDAMLLCMSLSKKNDEVGLYIADSNICPVNNLCLEYKYRKKNIYIYI